MRYHQIIDYDEEATAERLARLAVMYGIDEDADCRAQDADTELTLAKADMLRLDKIAAVEKLEAEYEELVLQAQMELLSAMMSKRPLIRPS